MKFQQIFSSAKRASREIGILKTEKKNALILKIAENLIKNTSQILTENKKDCDLAISNGVGEMIDRLKLTKERILEIANNCRQVAKLTDQVGKILEKKTRPNGLEIKRISVPIGVVGMIYESRPNVTIDAAVLNLKSGNAVILKGGSDARFSNKIFVQILKSSAQDCDINPDIFQFLDIKKREEIFDMLQAKEFIDLIIPRGGKNLINFVVKNSQIPIIETGASVVHVFVDRDADVEKSIKIVANSKFRRVSVCNAMDTLILDQKIANDFLKNFLDLCQKKIESKEIPGLKIFVDQKAQKIIDKFNKTKYFNVKIKEITNFENCFSTEFLDFAMNIKVISEFSEAIEHIQKFSLGHSECICTEDKKKASEFFQKIDAAAVFWNASTGFSDGGEFGLGAEIGISTQKLHARGPFALAGLTSYKWIVSGNGQIRK